VFDDIGGVGFGVGAEVFLVGDSPDSVTIDHNTIVNAPIAAFASSLVFLYGETSSGGPAPITNFVYTNNMSLHNAYGISASGFAAGSSTINAYLPNGIVLADVLAGGPASQYPAGNFFPTPAEWLANFVNPAAADYHLVAGSVYLNAGTDGTDLGPFIDEINRQTAIALSGNNAGGAAIPSAPTAFRITP
jgi:hypothetical protein